jgi:uncharacterized membrane protein YedE/YeeE
MTEADAAEVLNGIIANVISSQAVFFTVLSAYLVVAYTAGAKLTRYQVSFVNLLFLLVFLNLSIGQLGLVQTTTHYVDMIQEARGTNERLLSAQTNRVIFVTIRALMYFGAVLFMWQVRHPKTE